VVVRGIEKGIEEVNIQDLSSIKQALLDKHKLYEVPNPEEYREGVLGGITVALHLIDNLMENEDAKMSREFGED